MGQKKHNTTTCGVSGQLLQGSPRSTSTDYVAERQLEAVPDETEEQHEDVLQVFTHPLWS